MQILLSPETLNSTACVMRDGPMGLLYVQVIDAYGFQRELTVCKEGESLAVRVYQHPGRRESQLVTRAEGVRFIEEFCAYTAKYPAALFGPATATEPRCAGFVRLQERLFRGEELKHCL